MATMMVTMEDVDVAAARMFLTRYPIIDTELRAMRAVLQALEAAVPVVDAETGVGGKAE